MAGTPYTCLTCDRKRFSSNPKADINGTVCPVCALAERDQQRQSSGR